MRSDDFTLSGEEQDRSLLAAVDALPSSRGIDFEPGVLPGTVDGAELD